MNAQEFVNTIRTNLVEGSKESILSVLANPPGRKPLPRIVEMSDWFKTLSENEKKIVQDIIKESVESAVFGFLCVLDGVQAIEDSENKGQLFLFYEKNGERELLNNPGGEYLHDLFR